jgi:hypothetical protein
MTTITATGARGFLLWLKQQQPGIYQQLAPQLTKLVPEIFSAAAASLGKMRAIYKGNFAGRTHKQLGQYCSYFSAPSSTYISSPITVDYSSQLTTPIDEPTVDYSGSLSQPICAVSSLCPGPTPTLSSDTGSNIASAANTGPIAAGTASTLASAINAIAGTVLTAGEVGLLGKAIQAQLTNAQNGTAPSDISTAKLGVTTIPAKSSSLTDLLLLGAAGVVAWLVLS